MSHPALIQYPAQAAYGRVVPKAKIYAHSGASARLKELFVTQVERIVWQYKLAPETIKLAARPGVPEIQIFRVQLKGSELHPDVLRGIDKALPRPLIFELQAGDRLQVAAAWKRPGETEASRWVCSEYFASDWLPADSPRVALPVALHLGGLYEQLLQRLIPLPARPRESLAALVGRVELARAKEREVEKAAARLEKEKQFNRKVEINAELRTLKIELAGLTQ